MGVQRCADNKSILITTYEGTHNHSLPASAAAMASATSAAAAMLRSPSSTSQPLPGNPTPTTASAAVANLHGLNFTLTTNGPTPHPPFYFPNSSLSTSHSHPTITLDLTAPPPAAASHFTRLTPNFPSLPRFSSTCLNFSSSSSSSSPSFSWSHGYLGYGTVLPGNRTHIGSSYYRNDLLMNHQNAPPPPLPSLTETVDTATKAITSNPDFRSALQAAITSFVGNRGAVERENQGGGPNSGENAKWGYLSGLPSVISRQGRSSLLPSSSLQISTSQSSSLSSPADKVDRMK
ncbi:WRKY transcription factor [Sarracenia purpurea var. burkii]